MGHLFDHHVIVDWSANNSPKRGADSIWIYRCRVGQAPDCLNMPTRAQAVAWIVDGIGEAMSDGKRLLIGFDFGFGYPAGAAAVMSDGVAWRDVWREIAARVEDQEDNRSNRFDVGSHFNAVFEAAHGERPFWGHPAAHAGRYAHLETKRPLYNAVSEKRLVEECFASAQPMWKLAYTGSVGSQSLLGIARLENLRQSMSEAIAVWPFETAFDADFSKPVTLCEVYPSMIPVRPLAAEIKDAAQVRTLAEAFARIDRSGHLRTLLSAPKDLSEAHREQVLREEGWIVGARHDLSALAEAA
ncbi:hypothetical protein ACFQ14_15155 [Pseudahrensia aquimaris]|uniref:Cobalamin biosynthesis protein CbiG n=1 Tax=Pseudahrensia aquimaris TaxID=744461 RepID=A0ABW3FI03_9HYPH